MMMKNLKYNKFGHTVCGFQPHGRISTQLTHEPISLKHSDVGREISGLSVLFVFVFSYDS